MNKKYLIPGVISGITFLLTFFLFLYTDLTSLTVWTINVWDNLYETHNFRLFYEFSAMNLFGLDHAMVGSDILIYIPWALWNLPLWIVQKFFNYPAAYNAIPQLWSKLFLIFVAFLCIIPIKKICKEISNEYSEVTSEDSCRMAFLSCTSFFTIMSLGYAGQNDIMAIFPFLMALSCLLEGKKRNFYLWAALSIAFKPFFAFSFVAIVLLEEKNLLRILGKVALGFSVYFLQKVPFIGANLYKESLAYGPTSGGIKLLMQAVLDIPPAGASLFFLTLGALYLAIYFVDHEYGEDKIKHYIYSVTAPLILFFTFTRYEAYRPFYLVPMLFIMMMLKPAYSRINLLFEFAATGSLMAFYLLDDVLFYNPKYIWSKTDWVDYPSISEFLTSKLPGFGYTLFTAVFVLSMAFILIINHPKFKSENKVLTMKEEPWLLTVRSLVYAVPLMLSIAIKIIK